MTPTSEATFEDLNASHDTASFDCGYSPVNAWLWTRALANQAHGFSRTIVRAQDSAVTGFYALSGCHVQRSALPKRDQHGAPTTIPCLLLGQFGVDQKFHGMGLGDQLMLDAFRRADIAAKVVGFHLMGLQPAEAWLVEYRRRFDFEPVAGLSVEGNVSPLPFMIQSIARVRALLKAVASPT